MHKLLVSGCVALALLLFATGCGTSGREASGPKPPRSFSAADSPSSSPPATHPSLSAPPEEAEPVNYIRGVADEILRELNVAALPDDEKILACYRWMIENVYFADPVGQDIWRYRSEQETPPDFLETMSVSPLVFGIGSCEDFACALALLLEQAGFEALYVPGFTISVDGDYVDHAWTLVNMRGAWYHLDSQLEQNIIRDGVTAFRYFLKTDAEMLSDHKWGENLIEFWPDITGDEASRIRAEFTPPACITAYPQRPPEPAQKPARPDIDAVKAAIQEEKEKHGLLPDIPLENVPPVLIGVAAAPAPYARSFLTAYEQEVYDQLVEQANRFDFTPITLTARLPQSELDRLLSAVSDDQPQLYWLRVGREGNALLPGVTAPLTVEEAKRRQVEIDAAAARLLIGAGDTKAEMAIALHDRLAAAIRYDATAAMPDIHNLYGGLVRGEGVCDAFSRSYQYLLTKAEIENIYIAGTSARGVTHSWNAALLDDGWYYTDLTWNRPQEGAGTAVYHDYLSISYAEMALQHEFPQNQYPRFPAENRGASGYYLRSGQAVDPAMGRFADLLAEAFVNALENIPELIGGAQYLDAKVLCSAGDFLRYKEQYIGGLFDVLHKMERIATERGLSLRFETEGETALSFNDTMQILVIHPRVYPANS